MQITWLGHSCYLVESDGYRIVIDPYSDAAVPGLSPVRVEAQAVLCSHEHGDHAFREGVTLVPSRANPFTMTAVPGYHDDCEGTKRGSNILHVLEADGVRLCHLGDLGCALTDEQLAAIGAVDAVCVPVGGHYTIDAVQANAAVNALGARVVLPMHYHSDRFGFDVIGPVEDFLSLRDDVIKTDASTLHLTCETPRQTLVLTPALVT